LIYFKRMSCKFFPTANPYNIFTFSSHYICKNTATASCIFRSIACLNTLTS
jgi:hypothetical protein